jgi:hypothetical protein
LKKLWIPILLGLLCAPALAHELTTVADGARFFDGPDGQAQFTLKGRHYVLRKSGNVVDVAHPSLLSTAFGKIETTESVADARAFVLLTLAQTDPAVTHLSNSEEFLHFSGALAAIYLDGPRPVALLEPGLRVTTRDFGEKTFTSAPEAWKQLCWLQCARAEQRIGAALDGYANEHDGHFPSNLDALGPLPPCPEHGKFVVELDSDASHYTVFPRGAEGMPSYSSAAGLSRP